MSGSVSSVSRRSGGHLAGGGSGKLAMRRSHSLDAAENPAAAAAGGGSAVYSTVNVEAVPSGHVYKQLFDAGVSICCSEGVVLRFCRMISLCHQLLVSDRLFCDVFMKKKS